MLEHLQGATLEYLQDCFCIHEHAMLCYFTIGLKYICLCIEMLHNSFNNSKLHALV
jgi:hypothetical protein